MAIVKLPTVLITCIDFKYRQNGEMYIPIYKAVHATVFGKEIKRHVEYCDPDLSFDECQEIIRKQYAKNEDK